jgi:hypothetical protein
MMTITKAGICFLVAVVIFALAFVLDIAGQPWATRANTLGFAFLAAGLLLAS